MNPDYIEKMGKASLVAIGAVILKIVDIIIKKRGNKN